MSHERKKFTLYLHPENPADKQALDIIESIPRSSRGELFRHAFVSGIALQHIDSRLPALLATLFSHNFTAEQLVSLISQTTDWKPTQADIRDVIKALDLDGLALKEIGSPLDKNDENLVKVKQKLSKIM